MKSNILKKKVDNLKTPYNPEAWKQMEQRLDGLNNHQPKVQIPRYLKALLRIFTVSGIVLLVVLGYNTFTSSEKENVSTQTSRKNKHSGSPYIEENRNEEIHSAPTELSNTETPDNLVGKKQDSPFSNGNISFPSAPTVHDTSNTENHFGTSKTYKYKSGFSNSSESTTTLFGSLQVKDNLNLANKITNSTIEEKYGQSIDGFEPTSSNSLEKDQLSTETKTEIKRELLTEFRLLPMLKPVFLNYSTTRQKDDILFSGIPVKKKSRKSSRWSAYADFGYNAYYTSFGYTGYRINLGAVYQLSSRFTLESAATYFSAKPDIQPTEGTSYAKESGLSLLINFEFVKWRRHTLSVQAGGGLSIADAVKYYSTGPFSKSGTGLHYRLGGRYRYAVSRKTSLILTAFGTQYIETIRGVSLGIQQQF